MIDALVASPSCHRRARPAGKSRALEDTHATQAQRRPGRDYRSAPGRCRDPTYKAGVPPVSRAVIGRVSGSPLTFVVVVIVALWSVHDRWAVRTLLRLLFLHDPALPQALPIQTLLPPEKKVTKTSQRASHAYQFTPRCNAQREPWAVHAGCREKNHRPQIKTHADGRRCNSQADSARGFTAD
jgi:hypothetical protein